MSAVDSAALAGPDDRPVVRLRSPADVCDAVPYLVGFEPTDSLVAISLRGPRRRAGLTIRVDLPDAGDAPRVAGLVIDHLARDGASAAAAIAYGGAEHTAGIAVRALIDTCRDRGIEVVEALRVANGRWTSYSCAKACCPTSGTPLRDRVAEPSLWVAAMTLEGRQVLASRAELEGSVAPVRGLLANAMAARLEAEVDAFLDDAGGARSAAYADETVQLVRDCVERLADGETLTVDDAARILAGLLDRDVRDRCFGGGMSNLCDTGDPPLPPAALDLWRELVRRAVLPRTGAPVATLLAACAYLEHGNGALANVALDRALADQPSYVMAQYLRALLDGGIPPSTVRGWLGQPDDGVSRREPG